MSKRPPAALCIGPPNVSWGSIHGVDMLSGQYYLKIRYCIGCDQQIVRVDKTENLGPSDVGYEFVTRLIVSEWP